MGGGTGIIENKKTLDNLKELGEIGLKAGRDSLFAGVGLYLFLQGTDFIMLKDGLQYWDTNIYGGLIGMGEVLCLSTLFRSIMKYN